MKQRKQMLTVILPVLGMLVLILDSATALRGAAEGIDLCIRAVIPSLLPFFVLSILLTSAIGGAEIPALRPIGERMGLPKGAEGVFLVGLLGGYPVGAQSVTQLRREGKLSQHAARRMLGFCSNAGPAFIFGMAGHLFTSGAAPWLLWLIHILSAILVGLLLPGKQPEKCQYTKGRNKDFSAAVSASVKSLANVCCWIVLMRVLLAFLDRWFLWLLPKAWTITLSGLLELANGCALLAGIPAEPWRFVLCAAFLGFGGVCVGMQTVSVTKELGIGLYFPGKILQCLLSTALALPVAALVYGSMPAYTAVLLILCAAVVAIAKITVAFCGNLVYNKGNC